MSQGGTGHHTARIVHAEGEFFEFHILLPRPSAHHDAGDTYLARYAIEIEIHLPLPLIIARPLNRPRNDPPSENAVI